MKISKMRNPGSIFLIGLLFSASFLRAQELIPMGTWRSHFNYERTTLVEKTTSKVFTATSHGLMFYDQEDQSINKLSKVDGLSDVTISALAYNAADGYLALGYQNGNVDVITANGISNLPVLLNSDVTENKTVNHVSFYEGNMNLSTNFGLLVLTLGNQIIEAYQNLGENGEVIAVRNSVIRNGVLYLATEEGVIGGSLTNGDNLQDFNNWERYPSSLVYGMNMISVSSLEGIVYACSSNSLYKLIDGVWSNLNLALGSGEEVLRLKEGLNGLLILTNERVLTLNVSEEFKELSLPLSTVVNDVIQDTESTFWYADNHQGLAFWDNEKVQYIILNGPFTNIVKLKEQDGSIYAFPEIATDYTGSVSNGLGYSVFREGAWLSFDSEDLNGFSNISDIVVHEDQEWLASFGHGILNADAVVDFTNSPLQENEPGTGNTLVSGMAIDDSGAFWINTFDANSLLQWNGEETWEAFDFGTSASAQPTFLAINSAQQIWMTLGLDAGFGVLGFDIESGSHRYITSTATSLPSNQVNDIAFGLDDEIWFATERGLAYFPFAFGVIEDQTIDVVLPVFEDQILFEDKEVLSLIVDGGNRIWIGTTDGLWLFGENISELVEHFTTENSPLPSNHVIDLALHPGSGELFIATDQGVVSYRTNSSDGGDFHRQVKIFPNPVLPDFEGWVGMSGLTSDASIKITTISGQLVREVIAFGGSASWDLRDYTGKQVETGVYLVFSSNSDGSETFVGKIAVIN